MTHKLPSKSSQRGKQASYSWTILQTQEQSCDFLCRYHPNGKSLVHHVMHKIFETPTGVTLKGVLVLFFFLKCPNQPFEALALNATLWCCLGHLEVYVDFQSDVKLSGWRSEALVNSDVHEMERSARFSSAYQGLSASFSSGGLYVDWLGIRGACGLCRHIPVPSVHATSGL